MLTCAQTRFHGGTFTHIDADECLASFLWPLTSDAHKSRHDNKRTCRGWPQKCSGQGVQSVDTATGKKKVWAGGLNFESEECSEAPPPPPPPHKVKPANDRMANTGESFTAKANRHTQQSPPKLPTPAAQGCTGSGDVQGFLFRNNTGTGMHEKQTNTLTVRAAGQETHRGRRMGGQSGQVGHKEGLDTGLVQQTIITKWNGGTYRSIWPCRHPAPGSSLRYSSDK